MTEILSLLPLRDIFTLVPIFILVGILFYLSNREIKKSLEQSKRTHELLMKDRDQLKSELRESRMIRLNELAKAAEFGRQAQGLFHDLMSPLTSVVLHTEKLKNSTEHQSVEKAIDASRRIAAYIKDVRATLSREDVEKSCVLKEELETTLHLLAFRARELGVTITSDTDQTIWYGSPTKIRQIFSNLISNSLDSFEAIADKRERIIKITISNNVITVSDTGCGIPESHQKRIFEPFFTTKREDKGTGIGLATVKTIVEKNLHGKITLESIEGVGTTFTISFPRDSRDPAVSH